MPDRRRWIDIGIGVGVVAVIIAVVVVVLIVRSGGSESSKARIIVEEVINRVDTDRPRRDGDQPPNFASARVGQELISGDGVLTFQNSEARVDITVRELLRVVRTTPNTLWRLGQFEEDKGAVIELDQGKIFLLDRGDEASPFPVQVVTPAGTASPRGTWMSVSYDPTTETVEVECFRGTCKLENPLGRQLLTDQQKSGATKETAPTEPVYLDPTEVQGFQGLPEAESGEIPIPALEAVLPTVTPTPTPTPSPTPTPTPPRQHQLQHQLPRRSRHLRVSLLLSLRKRQQQPPGPRPRPLLRSRRNTVCRRYRTFRIYPVLAASAYNTLIH